LLLEVKIQKKAIHQKNHSLQQANYQTLLKNIQKMLKKMSTNETFFLLYK